MIFPDNITQAAERLLEGARAAGIMIVTAESCTGGLVAASLTEIPGSSDVFDRGFATYSNGAKNEILGVPAALLKEHGAVSEPVARAMLAGALERSDAGLGVAITGIAGPPANDSDKSVGLVHLAAGRKDGESVHEKAQFGDLGRSEVRLASVKRALELMQSLL